MYILRAKVPVIPTNTWFRVNPLCVFTQLHYVGAKLVSCGVLLVNMSIFPFNLRLSLTVSRYRTGTCKLLSVRGGTVNEGVQCDEFTDDVREGDSCIFGGGWADLLS